MKDFKQVDKCNVWPHLQAGKTVYAAIFRSKRFNERICDLLDWSVYQINDVLKEENAVFYEKVD